MATIAQYAGYVCSIASALAILIKPLREWIFGIGAIKNGQRCQLRNDILTIYYKHCDEETPTLRQYERENLDALYGAYTALIGNSFIKDIYNNEMRHWRVVT